MNLIFALASAYLAQAYPDAKPLSDISAFIQSKKPAASADSSMDDMIQMVLRSHQPKVFNLVETGDGPAWVFASYSS